MDSPAHSAGSVRGPWRWVPSLYFAQGIPNIVVTAVSVVMYKRLGLGNAEIAFFTSLIGLPWVLKPLWSPLVQQYGTRRGWTVAMQLLVAAGLAAAAFAIPMEGFFRVTLIAFTLVALASATHDVAADGFYMMALSSHEQAWFVGIRSTAFRAAMIVGYGVLVMLAGFLEAQTGLPTVQLEVAANEQPPEPLNFSPSDFSPDGSGEQRVVVSASRLELSLADRSKQEVDELVEQVRAWNASHGFYEAPLPAIPSAGDEAAGAAKPQQSALARWIRGNFGPKRTAVDVDRAGDAAVILMQLSQPLQQGEEQVVQFGMSGGDASFKVIEGERFVVTRENASQPFAAMVQVEGKLDQPSSAEFEVRSGDIPLAWMSAMLATVGLFLALCVYHYFVLPRPAADRTVTAHRGGFLGDFVGPFVAFFRKPRILALLAFLLLYRLPESQLIKLVQPFMLDSRERGGLALTTGEVGMAYGVVGISMLTLGGILGGFVAARDGLKRWLWPMAALIHLPNLAILFLAYMQPESLWVVAAAIGVEQFGYGFGFTAYMLYCLYMARGEHQTVHYALCTGFMALGMLIPGLWSGWLQELLGYQHFFIWVMLCTIPSFASVAFIPLDPAFGKKKAQELA